MSASLRDKSFGVARAGRETNRCLAFRCGRPTAGQRPKAERVGVNLILILRNATRWPCIENTSLFARYLRQQMYPQMPKSTLSSGPSTRVAVTVGGDPQTRLLG
jgi:hypothetical protein